MDAKTDRLVRKLRLRHLELLVALADTPTMRGAAGSTETEAAFGAATCTVCS